MATEQPGAPVTARGMPPFWLSKTTTSVELFAVSAKNAVSATPSPLKSPVVKLRIPVIDAGKPFTETVGATANIGVLDPCAPRREESEIQSKNAIPEIRPLTAAENGK